MTADIDNLDDMPDTEILARTLWGEARGEGFVGMLAVACVIKNRASKPRWWGTDTRSVCLKPFQFSCWLQNDPNRTKLLEVATDNVSYMDALKIANSSIDPDITHGADSYYADGTPVPIWAMGKSAICTIGHHIFFKTI